MQLGYSLTGSYGLAILFFAFAAKIIVFPLSLLAQKNSIKLMKLTPDLDHIKRVHFGDRNRINEESCKLYERGKYSPVSGLVPLLAQLALLFGMASVIRNPLEHIKASGFSPVFLGIDLNAPAMASGASPYFMIALLSGMSSYFLCLAQNRLNPAQRRMRFWGRWGMSIAIIAFSLYFPLVAQGGIGLYWLCSNALGIAVAFAANAVYNPKKLVPAELLAPPPKIGRDERHARRRRSRELAGIEKESVKRFHASPDKRKLVFYSVSGGQYKYYSEIIGYITKNTGICVHYITNDPDDELLKQSLRQLEAYLIGERRAIKFMLALRGVRAVVMTAPNLGQLHIKRSVADPSIEYVYAYHHFTSLMLLREHALDSFDTVLCVGPHQIEEIRRSEQLYGTRRKRLVKCGYGQIDKLLGLCEAMPKIKRDIPQVLIAPSWSEWGILDSCLGEVVGLLKGYSVFIRPHPEYVRRFPGKWQKIKSRFAAGNVAFDDAWLSNDSIRQSDILITDWSSIAYEFSYCTKRPSIYINTPMKVMNSEYHKLGIEPLDVALRNTLGAAVDLDKLDEIPGVVSDMLANAGNYSGQISAAVEKYLFYPGRSGEAGGKYLISIVSSQQ
jgi:YidC/Oxa1 family membrane protein insertase